MTAHNIGDFALNISPITEEMACQRAYEIFSSDPDLLLLPVIKGTRPVGLVNRQDFLVRLADRFGRDLYARKPVSFLMDTNPLVIEQDRSVDEVSQFIVAENPAALLTGFILADGGTYAGVVTALSLLQANVAGLERRTEELEIASRKSEEASKAKSGFLANISHELRTPLNAIIGFADLILMEPEGAINPPVYADYVGNIKSSGSHLLKLINDILDMSRIEAGKLELDREIFDAESMVRSTIRMLQANILKADLAIEINMKENLPDLNADERMIRQILMNLLSNAIKFTPAGGKITIAISTCGDQCLCLSVQDNGIGIPAHEIENVLKPFHQVENPMTRRFDGSGLGLPLVQAITHAHGGELKLFSQQGVGTTVSVKLPIALDTYQEEVA